MDASKTETKQVVISKVNQIIYHRFIKEAFAYYVLATTEDGSKVYVWISNDAANNSPDLLRAYWASNPGFLVDQESQTENHTFLFNKQTNLSDRNYAVNYNKSDISPPKTIASGAIITKILNYVPKEHVFNVRLADVAEPITGTAIPESQMIEIAPEMVIDYFMNNPSYFT